ncbi:TMhelix containing protein [Vibrio phage 1.101.O._10N.261.45.C6]|nr:TMhelix containing protein [Vibrio phage 1.101.O._10N.261.45.C6]
MIKQIVSGLLSPVTSLVDGWQTRKNIDAETKAEIARAKVHNKMRLDEAETQAKIDNLKADKTAETNYDMIAMQNMEKSYKDEYLIGLHTLPIWGYVIPSEALHMGLDKVWSKLETAPYWWWVVYIGMVAATFGLRWLFSKKRVDRMLGGK